MRKPHDRHSEPNENKLNTVKITGIVFSILIVITISLLLLSAVDGTADFEEKGTSIDRIVRLDTGWSCSVNGSAERTVDIPSRVFAKKGETVRYSNTVPDIQCTNPSVFFLSRYQFITVYLDGDVIYSNLDANVGLAKSNGINNNLIQLPAGCAGKTIVVEQMSPYYMYGGCFSGMDFGSGGAIVNNEYNSRVPYAVVLLFLVVLAVFTTLYGLVFIKADKSFKSFLWLGAFVFTEFIGLVGQVPAATDSFFDGYAIMEISSLAHFIAPLPLLMLLELRVPEKVEFLIRPLQTLSLLAFVVAVVLQFSGVFDFQELILVPEIINVLIAVLLIYCAYCRLKWDRQKKTVIEQVIVFIFALSLVAEAAVQIFRMYEFAGIFISIGLVIYSMFVFFSFSSNMMQVIKTNAQLTVQLQESKMDVMMSQMQPHFMYNTLNSIRALIKKDPDVAYSMIYDFSAYLRYNIRAIGNSDPILFKQEMKHIETYLNIELIRFSGRLSVEKNIEADDFYVLPLSVQPIVENAVKHGICKKADGGTLKIHSYKGLGGYYVEIADDGVGFDPGQKKPNGQSTGIGMDNIMYRLRDYNATLNIESTIGVGTTAVLFFPVTIGKGDEEES